MEREIRVLVIDGDRLFLHALVSVLGEIEGVVVIGATQDIEEARGIAEREQPAAVLLDLRPPWLEGLGAIRLFKQRWPEIVVVASVVGDEERIGRSALTAGVDVVLARHALGRQIAPLLRALRTAGPRTGGRR